MAAWRRFIRSRCSRVWTSAASPPSRKASTNSAGRRGQRRAGPEAERAGQRPREVESLVEARGNRVEHLGEVVQVDRGPLRAAEQLAGGQRSGRLETGERCHRLLHLRAEGDEVDA